MPPPAVSGLRLAVFVGWAAFVLAGTGPLWRMWGPFLSGFGGGGLLPATGAAGAAALGDHLLVAGLALLLAAVWGRAGRPPARWVGARAPAGWELAGLRLLLGWAAVGTALYALALAGLFRPGLVVAAAAGLGATGWRFRDRPAGPRGPAPSRLWLLVALPALALSPLLFVPPTYIDAWQYHLAVPEHFLRLHRYAAEGTNTGFNLELLCEVQNAFAVMIRREELSAWIALIPFLGAAGAAASWLSRRSGRTAGGLALGFLLAPGPLLYSAAAGKNDAAASGACLLALIAHADGRLGAAAACWGIAAATKINGLLFGLLAGTWWLARPGRVGRRAVLGGAALAALPLLPLVGRDWLVKGDPHWPLLSRWLPGALWDRYSEAAQAAMLGVGRPGPEVALGAWAADARTNLPAAVVALPAILLGWRALDPGLRRVAGMSAAFSLAFTVDVWYEHERMILPALVGWCLPAAAAIAGWSSLVPARTGAVVLGLACVAAWPPLAAPLSARWDVRALRSLTGAATREQFFSSVLTTAWDARFASARLPGLRNLLLVNDHAPYRWPARTFTEEFPDRKPTWVLARESDGAWRMAVRLRQGNITHIAHDSIGDFHVAAGGQYYRYYPWRDRDLAVLHAWASRWIAVEAVPLQADYANGGFYLYRVLRRPVAAPRRIPSLPGTKGVIWSAMVPYLESRDAATGRTNADALVRAFPDVDQFLHLRGSFSYHLGHWAEAYRDLAAAVRGGFVGDFTHGLAAAAAVNMRRPDLAEPLARRALELYPAHRTMLTGILAAAMALSAERSAEAGRGAARAALVKAREAAALSRPGPPLVRLCLGAVLRRAGEIEEARRILVELASDLPVDSDLLAECRAELAKCGPSLTR